MSEIKIGFEMEDIEGKSDSEKLNLLLKIAFLNHESLRKHGEILFGNGKRGLCECVREYGRAIKALWGLVFIIIGAFVATVFK